MTVQIASRCGAFLVLFSSLVPCGWAFSYSAKEIEGWVVDAETHQPLEGVNIVAHWTLLVGDHGRETDLVLMEAVTDSNGRYYFPEWGPVPIPAGLPPGARMQNRDPAIVFFKSGYGWTGVSNEITGPASDLGSAVRTSDWNRKTIEFKRFPGTLDQYGRFVSAVLTDVSWGGCEWKKIPRMMVALNREAERLSQQHVFNGLPTFRQIENTAEGKNCGSVQEFFKDHLK
jgi:hypothetical protein